MQLYIKVIKFIEYDFFKIKLNTDFYLNQLLKISLFNSIKYIRLDSWLNIQICYNKLYKYFT